MNADSWIIATASNAGGVPQGIGPRRIRNSLNKPKLDDSYESHNYTSSARQEDKPGRADSACEFDENSDYQVRPNLDFSSHDDELWPEMPFEALGHSKDTTQFGDTTELPQTTDIVPTVEMTDATMATTPGIDDEAALDPEDSERHYHRHPHTGHQREIWRPGDGDGDQRTEYYERGQVLPLEQRWRIFQTDMGEISYKNNNLPPRFVFLDDRAAYEVSKSDIPKGKIQNWWPHDFGSPAKIRKNRAHIGRPAIKDNAATGDARFYSTQLGGKGGIYYFSGQKDYVAVKYKIKPKPQPTEEELTRKRKHEQLLQELDEEEKKKNPRHTHNQYTPKDMMVKHGAASLSRKPAKVHNLPALPRASSIMTSTKSPFYIEKRLYGGIEQQARDAVASEAIEAVADRTDIEGSRIAKHSNLDLGAPFAPRAPSRLQGSATPDDQNGTAEPITDGEVEREQRSATPIGPVDVPRQMGYIERRDFVQKVKARVINTVQKQEDVQRLANELAEEKVKVGQHAKEIEQLKKQLDADKTKAQELESVGEADKTKVTELETMLGDKDSEIERLKAEVVAEKRLKVQLELKVTSHEETIKSLQADQER